PARCLQKKAPEIISMTRADRTEAPQELRRDGGLLVIRRRDGRFHGHRDERDLLVVEPVPEPEVPPATDAAHPGATDRVRPRLIVRGAGQLVSRSERSSRVTNRIGARRTSLEQRACDARVPVTRTRRATIRRRSPRATEGKLRMPLRTGAHRARQTRRASWT